MCERAQKERKMSSLFYERHGNSSLSVLAMVQVQSELLGQFRLIGDRASDVSGGRICLTQNAYAEI